MHKPHDPDGILQFRPLPLAVAGELCHARCHWQRGVVYPTNMFPISTHACTSPPPPPHTHTCPRVSKDGHLIIRASHSPFDPISLMLVGNTLYNVEICVRVGYQESCCEIQDGSVAGEKESAVQCRSSASS